jgi:hypothetical protein
LIASSGLPKSRHCPIGPRQRIWFAQHKGTIQQFQGFGCLVFSVFRPLSKLLKSVNCLLVSFLPNW